MVSRSFDVRNANTIPAALVSLLLANGCASALRTSSEKSPPEISLDGGGGFDIATCSVRVTEVPLNEDGVRGGIMSSMPAFRECLLRSGTRLDEPFDAQIQAAILPNRSVRYGLMSSGISERGQTCVLAIARRLKVRDARATDGTDLGVDPNPNELTVSISDVPPPLPEDDDLVTRSAVILRSGQTLLCPCYRAIGTADSPVWALEVTMQPDRAPEYRVLSPSKPFATCVEQTLKGFQLPPGRGTFMYRPPVWDSRRRDANPRATIEEQVAQWSIIFERRFAEVTIAAGERVERLMDYARAPNVRTRGPVASLNSCKALLAADDNYLFALQEANAVGEKSLVSLQRAEAKGMIDAARQRESLTQIMKTLDDAYTEAVALRESDDTVCRELASKVK